MKRRLVGLVAACSLGHAAAAGAQEPVTGWRGESPAGSARVDVDAGLQWGSSVSFGFLDGIAAPFLGEHWQLGLAPQFQRSSFGDQTFYAGTLALVANYFLDTGRVSRPYVGVLLAQNAATGSTAYGTIGLQAGWLHFLSPAVAFRAEARYRHYLGVSQLETADVFVTFDNYLFGRAREPVTRLPSLGVFDATMLADFSFRPQRIGSLDASVAPFLAQWLQVGSRAQLEFFFNQNDGAHYLELFGRGYLPVGTRVVPFADLFGTTESISGAGGITRGGRGYRAGARAYLTAGVALDVALEWRQLFSRTSGDVNVFGFSTRTLRASLTTQFRAQRR